MQCVRGSARYVLSVLLFSGILLTSAASLAAQDVGDGYQTPAPELTALVDAPVTPGISLSPDESVLLLTMRPSLPSIAEVASPELKIAGMRINPRNNGPSRSRPSNGLALRTLDGDERSVTGLPENPRIRNTRWSPNGRWVAFTHDTQSAIELWLLDATSASARRLSDLDVSNVGSAFAWAPGGDALYVQAVPPGRGPPPEEPMVPTGPRIEETSGETAPARTYQDLLQNPHDEALYEYYATAQLARVSLDGSVEMLGQPAIIAQFALSPGDKHILVTTVNRPYSYQVPASRFPRTIEVWDGEGNAVHRVAELPLQDKVPTSFGSVPAGVRSVSWRPDADATLYWVEAQDGGDALAPADIRDKVFAHEAPFSGQPVELAALPLRYGGITWAEEGFGLINESWFSTRQRRTYRLDPDNPGNMEIIFDLQTEDRYNHPGFPLFALNERGRGVLRTADGGRSIYLAGQGASPEGNRPFLRKRNLETGAEEELFRSEAPYYEGVVDLLADGKLLTRRESVNEPPNYYLRDLDNGTVHAVTDFPHPYPQFAGIHKEEIQYEREDGVPLSATLYLPAGYDKERDGPLPTFIWAYPTEFKSAAAAGQRRGSPFQFTRISYSGAVPYVTRGFAVLDNASMPVIGEGDAEPNDTFRDQLVANAQAAVDEGVRRGIIDPLRVGVGGHSYGAFMTGNLLAHSDIFQAGVARSGAYNRTLTPFGFQREQRLFWEAPDLYFYMSPFMHADKVNEPILLIHGEDDNNSGTFPIQSRRFYAALKGLGATARLVFLPAESHGYAARESVLHVLWETDRWLQMHVKKGVATTTDDASDDQR